MFKVSPCRQGGGALPGLDQINQGWDQSTQDLELSQGLERCTQGLMNARDTTLNWQLKNP